MCPHWKPRQMHGGIRAANMLLIIYLSLFTALAARTRERSEDRPGETWRLGVFLWHESPNDLVALQGIREALSETGRPYELVVRQANSDRQEAEKILREFQAAPMTLLFAMGTEAALMARDQIQRIPVVFTAVTHPVESMVVRSWSGSGNHLAGNSNWIGPETLLNVFHLAVPRLERLGILRSSTTGVVSAAELLGMREYLSTTSSPTLEIIEAVADSVEDIRPAVHRLLESKVQAIWIPIDFLIYKNMEEVLSAMENNMLPLVSSSLKGAEAGAVAGVLVDYAMLGRRAVAIALKVLLEGRDPATLPVETMNSYQVVVNLGAARRCGYELPLSLLVLADIILTDDEGMQEKSRGE
ncbi:MAG: ABC transporter substrate-binding protein [Planctomycetota bacterium]